MKFWYMVQDSIPHSLTVGICYIIFIEREKGIAKRQYIWRLQSLLRLADVWELYWNSRMKNWKNLRELLEMLLSLSEDTWVRALRVEWWVIYNWELVRTCVGILRGLNWGFILECLLNYKFSFMIINKILMF